MPATPQFDTLAFVETLKSSGYSEAQAKGSAEALTKAFGEWGSGFLATKGDIQDLRTATQKDIQDLRTATQKDIQDLRIATQKDIQDLREDITGLKLEVADLRSDMKVMKWMLGVTAAGVGTLLAGVATLVIRTFVAAPGLLG